MSGRETPNSHLHDMFENAVGWEILVSRQIELIWISLNKGTWPTKKIANDQGLFACAQQKHHDRTATLTLSGQSSELKCLDCPNIQKIKTEQRPWAAPKATTEFMYFTHRNTYDILKVNLKD
jgi:hypothetical protein